MHESAHDIYERSLAFVKKTVSIMERIWVVRVCVPQKESRNYIPGLLLFVRKEDRTIMKFVTSCSKCGKRVNADEILDKSSASALVKVEKMEKETKYVLCPKCSNKLKKWMGRRW